MSQDSEIDTIENRGFSLLDAGNWGEARACFRSMLSHSLEPIRRAGVLRNIMGTYFQEGEHDKAIEFGEQALNVLDAYRQSGQCQLQELSEVEELESNIKSYLGRLHSSGLYQFAPVQFAGQRMGIGLVIVVALVGFVYWWSNQVLIVHPSTTPTIFPTEVEPVTYQFGAFAITVLAVWAAFGLRASPKATLGVPVLIFSSVWALGGMFASIAFAVDDLRGQLDVVRAWEVLVQKRLVFYVGFAIAGVVMGVRSALDTQGAEKHQRAVQRRFLKILLINIVQGTILSGLVTIFLCLYILYALKNPIILLYASGAHFYKASARIGLTIGFIASLVTYVLWRLAIKVVWR